MSRRLLDHAQKLWREVWLPLEKTAVAKKHPDLFCEVYGGLLRSDALQSPPNDSDQSILLNTPPAAKEAIRKLTRTHYRSEWHLVNFLEETGESCQDLGGDPLYNRYFGLLERFLASHGLKYDLRRPCTLCPTISGLFASLVSEFAIATNADPHLNGLWKEVEQAVRDLRTDASESRIKTVISKQFNLLESVGRSYPGVTSTTFGGICDQVDSWPHESLKACAKNLYKFACDYPGIRHGGTPASKLREVDMREILGVSLVLTAFTTYLTKLVDSNLVYGAKP